MKLQRTISVLAASGLLSFAAAGTALADTSCSFSNTGADSTASCTVNNTNTLVVNNSNSATVTNTNTQTATTGDALILDSTGAGDAKTGDASNNATTTTTISFGSPVIPVPGGGTIGGSGGVSGNGGGNGGAQGGVGGGSLSLASGGNGGVGGGSLPDTGASSPIDLTSLRNAFKPSAHANALAQQTQNTSRALLAAGAVLSLLGALGSAIYANKKQVKA